MQNYYKPQKYACPMQKAVLSNELTVIYTRQKSKSVVVEVMVKVGSNHEKGHERGISHFLEHILFEGTAKRSTNQIISNEIEKIGGDFNAYTTAERTCFYVKVLKKHFPVAVDILADILQNSLFRQEDIEKEKKVVLKEIDMVFDEAKFYQWILFQKTLYQKHPCRNPTYGDKKVIQSLSQKEILQFFHTYYQPKNMVVSIVGDVKHWKEAVMGKFVIQNSRKIPPLTISEPTAKHHRLQTEKRNIVNTYLVLGFKTVPRLHKDSAVLEVINGILGRGQSGRMFTEIRSKRGLAYDVGTQHVGNATFGYFAVYASIDRKNVNVVRKVILEEIGKLKNVTIQDVQEAQDFIEGDFLLELEDTQKVADNTLFWEQVHDAKLLNQFLHDIKKVTVSDVQRVVNTYCKKHTMVVLQGK